MLFMVRDMDMLPPLRVTTLDKKMMMTTKVRQGKKYKFKAS